LSSFNLFKIYIYSKSFDIGLFLKKIRFKNWYNHNNDHNSNNNNIDNNSSDNNSSRPFDIRP